MWGHATPIMIYTLSMISDFSAKQAGVCWLGGCPVGWCWFAWFLAALSSARPAACRLGDWLQCGCSGG